MTPATFVARGHGYYINFVRLKSMSGHLSEKPTAPYETWTKFLNALLSRKKFDLRETWFVNVYNGLGMHFRLGFKSFKTPL